MIMLAHPHQDPGGAVLNVLYPLDALARELNEECTLHTHWNDETSGAEVVLGETPNEILLRAP